VTVSFSLTTFLPNPVPPNNKVIQVKKQTFSIHRRMQISQAVCYLKYTTYLITECNRDFTENLTIPALLIAAYSIWKLNGNERKRPVDHSSLAEWLSLVVCAVQPSADQMVVVQRRGCCLDTSDLSSQLPQKTLFKCANFRIPCSSQSSPNFACFSILNRSIKTTISSTRPISLAAKPDQTRPWAI